MKKILAVITLTAALLCTAGCGGDAPAATEATAEQKASVAKEFKASDVTDAVLAEVTINSAFEKSADTLGDFFTELDTSKLTDSSYYICASGAYPDEIAVFVFADEASAEEGKTAVQQRLDEQKATYETYTPDEFYKLEGAVIEVSGKTLYYLVTSDNSKAEEIVKSYIG